MLSLLEQAQVKVSTVHATQGRITDANFLRWGRQTIEIAERLDARAITVHPNGVERRMKRNFQKVARGYLRQLQRHTDVIISVETFGGRDRVFTPEEIIEAKLPMTLDVAHISDGDRIARIIEGYWRHIAVVHLSARASTYWRNIPDIMLSDEGRREHHLPIDPFCLGLVRKLIDLAWSGDIALEYLPWYHYRLRPDVELVRQALDREVAIHELVPPCDAHRGKRDMWGHDAPAPNTT